MNGKPDPEELKELLQDDKTIQTNPGAHEKHPTASHSGEGSNRGLEFLYDVPLQISVELGRSKILLRDLLKMGEGYVIELDKLAGEPLDLYVNSRLIARGEAVMVGDKFGIRLTDVVSTADRVENLG
ncbi:MAG: flagellar motor switch protein FliN [Proteobacteria bacterium]|nr:flagellar motor switch protein FliN [Pseudomonadota bacterium]MBU1649778.1 flagellar motor switch protein FliN [Pseudomonadota bacterium]